ncbi:MAG: hypothetical protein LUE23_05300 [Lachnospiraceae bacterium]|nr:hypothetical protein [Lachnospiraceae bacterium]
MNSEELKTRWFLLDCQQRYLKIAQRHHGLCADTAAHYGRAIAAMDREKERKQRRRENIKNGLLLLASVAVLMFGALYCNMVWPLA